MWYCRKTTETCSSIIADNTTHAIYFTMNKEDDTWLASMFQIVNVFFGNGSDKEEIKSSKRLKSKWTTSR